ncbi:MAG: hypothetical protein NTW54_08370 [Bacteroidetes bacterium]|nr:hypothetical protein [Bacteroidota bacterium]
MNTEKIESDFKILQTKLKAQFKRQPSLDAILFIIGMNALGKGNIPFDRDEKMNLLHVAHCTVFALSGYYELERLDEDGWPHFKTMKQYPAMELAEQEVFLKEHILKYFKSLAY